MLYAATKICMVDEYRGGGEGERARKAVDPIKKMGLAPYRLIVVIDNKSLAQ